MHKDLQLIWIAGMMKSGSTWLSENLAKANPSIALSPIKELSFFWDAELRYYHKHKIGNDLTSKNIELVKSHGLERKVVAQLSSMRKLQMKRNKIGKLRQWIFQPRFDFTDQGFKSYEKFILNGSNKKILLDPSIENAIISPVTLQKVKNQYPNFKVILLLRDPVDRFLSQANMMFKRHEDHTDWFSNVNEFLDSYNSHNEYKDIIHNFREILAPEQLCIRFYDEIFDNPENLLSDIFEFLQIEQKDFQFDFNTHKNKQKINLKKETILALFEKLEEQYTFCEEEFPFSPYPKKWKEKYQVPELV